ncbi:MAG: sugar phosphate isomerase/epimerase [Akkermansiaceae bacterium]|nr:sugar phosphate isomerase/epimerase [Akkermansiaceae bacterium]NNM29354.1 sugar phosphate isomerase/epimerase [Akkermansiaceae bacterium]
MFLTGFADEAAPDLATQIKATKELGWNAISARSIDGKNIHELTDKQFDKAAGKLEDADIKVVEFGSLIGNWGKKITSDFALTLGEIERAIPRMKRLGTRLIRIMSYAQEPWGEDQHEEERFKRLRAIQQAFADAGLVAAHENCMNYGGFSAKHSLRLVEEVPGLKLIFDTGNPVFQRDRSKSEPYPWQDALGFYNDIKEHVVHIHVKDARYPELGENEPRYTMPGEGDAHLREVLRDLKARRYNGGISIEPHVATVFHVEDGEEPDWKQCFRSYVEYGGRLEDLLDEMAWEPEPA